MTKQELGNALDNTKARSAWNRGVLAYAWELFDTLGEAELREITALLENGDYSGGYVAFKNAVLNGADSWGQYSWGGCSLVYDTDIAKRLCNPSELKRTHNGTRRPNAREEWLDTQERALTQASLRLWETVKKVHRLQHSA